MANRAYLRVWTRDFSESTMIPQFARFLATAPLSAAPAAFTELIVQPVDSTEPSAAEWDLRDQTYGAPEVAALGTCVFVTGMLRMWLIDEDHALLRPQVDALIAGHIAMLRAPAGHALR